MTAPDMLRARFLPFASSLVLEVYTMKTFTFLVVLGGAALAQQPGRVPTPLPPSLDIKTPAEPSVQTFPSESAVRPHRRTHV